MTRRSHALQLPVPTELEYLQVAGIYSVLLCRTRTSSRYEYEVP